MGETANAAQFVHAVEHAAVRVIVIPKTDKLISPQRDGVAEFRRARLLLARRKDRVPFAVATGLSPPVLGEDKVPEVTHLQEVANVDVFCRDPAQDGWVVAWRAADMDVVIRGVPAAGRHVDPSLQFVRTFGLVPPPEIDGVCLHRILVALREFEPIGADGQSGLEGSIDIEGAVRLQGVPVGSVRTAPHDGDGLRRRVEWGFDLGRGPQHHGRIAVGIREPYSDWGGVPRAGFEHGH